MIIFSDYANYYNLIYKNKDYQSEVNYVEQLINRYATRSGKRILDVGCGTGYHAIIFQNKGYDVFGIDLSQKMIDIANINNKKKDSPKFKVIDSTSFDLDQKFDVIISLFHVMSYQCSNEALESSLLNIYNHLDNSGLFIFDFWYGPAVLNDKPNNRYKEFEDENLKIIRITESKIDYNKNVVKVNFTMVIQDKKLQDKYTTLKETHNMRYFFLPELNYILNKIGFTVLACYKWLQNDSVSVNSWYGTIIAKKLC